MKIVIADPLPSSATDLLRDEGWNVDAQTGRTAEELHATLADADALIDNPQPLTVRIVETDGIYDHQVVLSEPFSILGRSSVSGIWELAQPSASNAQSRPGRERPVATIYGIPPWESGKNKRSENLQPAGLIS